MVTALAFAATLVRARPASASIVMALDLPDLVSQADHIALCDVLSQRADWDDKHERILSTVELKVVERWKGPAAGDAADDHITVVQPGGTVGDLTMTVTGMSTFTPGERTLLFLRGRATSAQVVGMSQGKRIVRYEAASQKWIVRAPDLRQTTLVKPRVMSPAAGADGLPPAPVVASSLREMSLDDLRVRVKGLLGAPKR